MLKSGVCKHTLGKMHEHDDDECRRDDKMMLTFSDDDDGHARGFIHECTKSSRARRVFFSYTADFSYTYERS